MLSAVKIRSRKKKVCLTHIDPNNGPQIVPHAGLGTRGSMLEYDDGTLNGLRQEPNMMLGS
jgi:hypothetical protein